MIFISTPFSKKAVDRLVKFKVPAFKIGSGECNNYPLLNIYVVLKTSNFKHGNEFNKIYKKKCQNY